MLDLWIVGMYLIVTLISGIVIVNDTKNFQTFSIADRKYSTLILFTTLATTFLGGGDILGGSEKAFKQGFIFMIFAISNLIYSMIIANVIAPNIDKYLGCISIGDIMKNLFGKKAQILTGIAGILKDTTIIGAQLSAIGYILHYFLGFSHYLGIYIAGLIVIIYSTTGGTRAIAIRSPFQFIISLIAILIIVTVGVNYIGGYKKLFHHLPKIYLQTPSINNSELIQYIDTSLIIILTIIRPTNIQRLLMAKSSKQAVRASRYAGVIYFLALCIICLIGIVAKILAPNLDPRMAIPYMTDLLPEGLCGLTIIGLLSIPLFTAESLLNTVAVFLVNDVVTPLLNNNISEPKKLQLARLSIFIIGSLSIIGAINFDSALDIVIFAHIFWNPLIVIPFFVAIIGFKLNKSSFWYSAIGGFIVAVLWKITNLQNVLGFRSILPGMIANIILLFASHYYYKKFLPQRFTPITLK